MNNQPEASRNKLGGGSVEFVDANPAIPHRFRVPRNVKVLFFNGCSGGDVGEQGEDSHASHKPGHGGKGGHGSPMIALPAGGQGQAVKEGDVIEITIGRGGTKNLPRTQTVVESPGIFKHVFDGPMTAGGEPAGNGFGQSGDGQSSPDAPGGSGATSYTGHRGENWGGAGGGGGAGRLAGGKGGVGGCDKGSEISYPGHTHDPEYLRKHAGQPGESAAPNSGGGGGGGGGGGDVNGKGGPGGDGGSGYLRIDW